MKPCPTARLCLAIPAILASAAHAQWTYTNLHPEAFNYPFSCSQAHGCDGTEVVGWIDGVELPGEFSPGPRRGCIWHETSLPVATFPVTGGLGTTILLSVSNGQYMGSLRAGDDPSFKRATLWTGHTNSWISLRPEGAQVASGNANHNGEQVGFLIFENDPFACLWRGTAESWVNLEPPGWTNSEAYDVYDGQQVGGVADYSQGMENFIQHAGLWHGTMESWVDLHPNHEPRARASTVWGTSREQQVGFVAFDAPALTGRPALWSGSPQSWVDLMPVGASLPAEARAVSGGWQIGYVTINGGRVASLWHNSAESWINLQQFLPPGTTNSVANDVWTDGVTIRIVGTRNASPSWTDGRAFLLTRILPCATDLDNDGSLANGGTPDENVDINDLLFFLQAFEAGALAADLDNNGDPAATIPDNAVDVNDLLFFLARFEGGC